MKRKTKRGIISFLILSPTFTAIGIFVYFFIGWTARTSVSNWNSFSRLLKGEFEFVGLKNYLRLFEDPRFQTDLWNTLYFTLFFILGCLILGIILAILVDRNMKGSSIFRNIYLFPMALSFVVTGAVWRWIFAPGILPASPQGMNLLFDIVGLDFLQWKWFTSTESFLNFNVALTPVIIAAIWQMSGYTMAMYLAGLRGIAQDLVEAAEVDGATGWQIFWRIKFPILRPITLSAMIILGHISLKIFDLVYAMTGSGPNNVTDVPAIYMFETTFRANKYATGSAIAIVMLLMVAVVIIPYLASSFRKEKRI
ncbi:MULTISPECIES: carbohydrate ABC transporter permease [unclassified Mesotoga]|uniref:carbohydrate ABC transporter permease n=1 Tax=unclassified Mesotoga TaxID=1184398 RepID=UPI000DA643C9|nr:sugar ABC transporter permease [Mesotoga sp. TolDC]PZC52930.1 sugar ABC transporter permease [Mesotoga sp. TolDC]